MQTNSPPKSTTRLIVFIAFVSVMALLLALRLSGVFTVRGLSNPISEQVILMICGFSMLLGAFVSLKSLSRGKLPFSDRDDATGTTALLLALALAELPVLLGSFLLSTTYAVSVGACAIAILFFVTLPALNALNRMSQ